METIILERLSENIALITLNRPKILNAMSKKMFEELSNTMNQLSEDPDIRCIILNANGRAFCAGIDINYLRDFFEDTKRADTGRTGIQIREKLKILQSHVTSLERCTKPVIAVTHGLCLGAGLDLITACDIRICSADTIVGVRETRIGMAADIGTLQRLQKVVGNQSWVREMAFTGKDVKAVEATGHGLFSRCLENKEKALEAAKELANEIAAKSPVALVAAKTSLIFSRDHSVNEGLDHIANYNASALQTEDLARAIMATMQKTKPVFPKL
ncbi:unnamed protein product [Blepharisma stoltei]|uniref:Uncharacterized protein n=1 Tax=Blepharisma stoltei TaxID=1481888 RepID=A0AAU9JVT9_9CILI|nr:unnamed protein product [Blepharisma stoltei]